MANACKLQAVEKQSHFGGRLDERLDPPARGSRNQREEPVDARRASLPRGLCVEGMHEAGLKIAGIAKVYGQELFTALVEGVELELCRGVVEPGHALGRGAPGARRNNHLESTHVTAAIALLAAMIEPENAERENAIDDRGGLCFRNSDHRVNSGAEMKLAANIGGTEAVLQIHGRTQAVDPGANEVPAKDSLEQAEVVFTGSVASGWGTAVVGSDELKGLRLGDAHAAREDAEALCPVLQIDYGTDEVAFLAPHLQQATPVLFAHGEARETHVEEHAPIFEQRSGGMVGKILLKRQDKLAGRQGFRIAC